MIIHMTELMMKSYIKLRAACEYLNCSESTVRRLVKLREIPGVVKVGHNYRFDFAVLEKWLEESLARKEDA